MSHSIPFYVREFNAVSFPEAIFTADQLMRETGVKLAVWRNRSDSLSDEQVERENRLLKIFETEASRKNNSSPNAARTAEVVLHKKGDDTFQYGDALQYLSLSDDDHKWVLDRFSYQHSELIYERGYNRTEIHCDGQGFGLEFGKKSGLSHEFFYGMNIRIIRNIKGTSTRFFSNYTGDNVYHLPSKSLGFFDPADANSGGTFHAASKDYGQPRLVHILDLGV